MWNANIFTVKVKCSRPICINLFNNTNQFLISQLIVKFLKKFLQGIGWNVSWIKVEYILFINIIILTPFPPYHIFWMLPSILSAMPLHLLPPGTLLLTDRTLQTPIIQILPETNYFGSKNYDSSSISSIISCKPEGLTWKPLK